MWKRATGSLIAAAVALATASALACGPFFPSDVILRTDEQMVTAPVADFAHELQRLTKAGAGTLKSVPQEKKDKEIIINGVTQTAAADVADLRTALRDSGREEKEIDRQAAALKHVRDAVERYAAMAQAKGGGPSDGPVQAADVPAIDLLEGIKDLPKEFVEYERGAIAYWSKDIGGARKAWESVLALPEGERKYRGVWAAYMIGRACMNNDVEKARESFRKCRALAKAGSVDTVGLAAASLGWEGQLELNGKNYEAAIALYMEQLAGAGWSTTDVSIAARLVLKETPEIMARVARDELSRRVITARLLTEHPFYRIKPEAAKRWLHAVEEAKITDVAGADRLAWAMYTVGDIEGANRWLSRLEKDTAVSYWLRAKLALREGKGDDAAGFLAKASREFPAEEEWADAVWDVTGDPQYHPKNHVQGELAVLKLSRGQFSDALDLLLKAGFWQDAAYVGERVLTVEELKTYVDKHVPAVKADTQPARDPWEPSGSSRDRGVRELLARRLMRLGRSKEAIAYFSPALQARARIYVEAIRAGHDARRPATERGKRLWEAAQIARYEGIDLLATELEPDYAIWGGNFETGSIGEMRTGKEKDAPTSGRKTINVATTGEARRLADQPAPEKRFHYRYVAAELAWAAASLLPDEDATTAQVLCEAGTWLKARDPKYADKFYKALVKRCETTDLGSSASILHWFPENKRPATPLPDVRPPSQ